VSLGERPCRSPVNGAKPHDDCFVRQNLPRNDYRVGVFGTSFSRKKLVSLKLHPKEDKYRAIPSIYDYSYTGFTRMPPVPQGIDALFNLP
jgi:hypothetical protein